MSSEKQEAPVLTAARVVSRACLLSLGGDGLEHATRRLDAFLDPFSTAEAPIAVCEAGGSICALEYLAARERSLPLPEMATAASRGGHVHILQWLLKRDVGRQVEWDEMNDAAARHGHLQVVQWIHDNLHEQGCVGAVVMDLAATYGHMHILRWLHENCEEGCCADAMDGAATHGHFEVVRWLHENRRAESMSSFAPFFAWQCGYHEINKWLEPRCNG